MSLLKKIITLQENYLKNQTRLESLRACVKESENEGLLLNHQIHNNEIYHEFISVYLIGSIPIEQLCIMILEYCIELSLRFDTSARRSYVGVAHLDERDYKIYLKNPYLEFRLPSKQISTTLSKFFLPENNSFLYYGCQFILFEKLIFNYQYKPFKCNCIYKNKKWVKFDAKISNKQKKDIIFYIKKNHSYQHYLTHVYIHKMFLPFYNNNYITEEVDCELVIYE